MTEVVGAGLQYTLPSQPDLWQPVPSNTNQIVQLLPGAVIKTDGQSSAVLLYTDSGMRYPIGPDVIFRILPPEEPKTFMQIVKGFFFFFRRGDPEFHRLSTPTVACATEHTEYSVEVWEDGTTIINIYDGTAHLTAAAGELVIQSGGAAIVRPGSAPEPRPILDLANAVQWRLYYPGILDPGELSLNHATQPLLSESLAAYSEGDLQDALRLYPQDRQPENDAERIYKAALLLSVGQVSGASNLLHSTLLPTTGARVNWTTSQRCADALLRVISTVKLKRLDPLSNESLTLSTEWLSESIVRQATGDLAGALVAAQNAARISPQFSFAWARLASLEFSFGRNKKASAALDRSLQLGPRNAQSHAVHGFLLTGQRKTTEAMMAFNRAIAFDKRMANAWLGRGLVYFKLGQSEKGLRDLRMAALLEPQRAVLRSYLSKGLNELGEIELALEEVRRAMDLDPDDPTGWLYSALFDHESNRINAAIRNLEYSQRLNDNREVYRSRMLLDQDQAVRSANLAQIYDDAGMTLPAVREASTALVDDYANYSAHLFLANSYNALRDPGQVSLRYDNAFQTEYLVANLFAPVSAGPLSSSISQQEYSQLFEQDRLNLISTTSYSSDGNWDQAVSQFGIMGDSAWSVDALYSSYESRFGPRPNNNHEQLSLAAQYKHQVTESDTVFLQAIYYHQDGGDLGQRYNPEQVLPALTFEESQEPVVLLGARHHWTEGSDTLFLAGRLHSRTSFVSPDIDSVTMPTFVGGQPTGIFPVDTDLDTSTTFEIFTGELQHVWTRDRHTMILGAHAQLGKVKALSSRQSMSNVPPFPANQVFDERFEYDYRRFGGYVYSNWRLLETLSLSAGIAYDRIHHPKNFRNEWIGSGEVSTDRTSPKAGVVWKLHPTTTARFAYTRALGGISLEQSYRLEPTIVGGMNQSFRSLAPESEIGQTEAARQETIGGGVDIKLRQNTYLGVEALLLRSRFERTIGGIDHNIVSYNRIDFLERTEFEEINASAYLHQLIGSNWALGVQYLFGDADLVADTDFAAFSQSCNSQLHQLRLSTHFNHPSGFFARAEAHWYGQDSEGINCATIPANPTSSNDADSDFWQQHVWMGYRLPRPQAEIQFGVLNLSDTDYRLSPLNRYQIIPRQRTFTASLQFKF